MIEKDVFFGIENGVFRVEVVNLVKVNVVV